MKVFYRNEFKKLSTVYYRSSTIPLQFIIFCIYSKNGRFYADPFSDVRIFLSYLPVFTVA